MKKLFTILGILLSFATGISATLAEEIPVTITPDQQYAIMGSILNFGISTSGAVTQNSKIQVILPNNLMFLSSSIPPRNLLQVVAGEQPYWLVNSGDIFNINLVVKETAQEFSQVAILANFVNGDEGTATGFVDPIADIQVEKTMTSPSPRNTGDTVSFDVVIKNIGSQSASSVKAVDIWPSNILTFANYGMLNGSQIVPYIYNGIINQYEFSIGDIEPGEEKVLSVGGTMDTLFPVGTEFVNTAFAFLDSANTTQYSTGNDTSSVTGIVAGYSNLYVNAEQLSQDPTTNGDSMKFSVTFGNSGQEKVSTGSLVIYLPEIMNQNNVSASLQGATQEGNRLIRELNGISAGSQQTITISGQMMTSSPVGTEYLFRAVISTEEEEVTLDDNESILTGKIQRLFVGELSASIQNLTRPNMNVNDTQIQAISGDQAKISIILTNNGNVIQTGFLRVKNNGEIRFLEEVSLIPGKSSVFYATGIAGPKNYQSMTPEIIFTYGDGLNISKSVQINEPLQCGDGFITQTEACDTASTEGLLPGQHCSDDCRSIITDNIVNTACIEYSTERGNGQICDDEIIYIGDQDYMCKSITSPGNVVQVDEDDEGSMVFTCQAANGINATSIKIECGNGQSGYKYNSNTFSYTCNYQYDEDGDNDYTASCIVNGEKPTNPSCEKDIIVGPGIYGNCGNGIIEPGETCDLWKDTTRIWKPKTIGNYLDYYGNVEAPAYMVNNGYSCKNCQILYSGDFVYEPVGCMQTDTPISVMDNEIIPFWWRLRIKDTQRVTSKSTCYNYGGDKTLLLEDSMECYFAVYNGKSYSQLNDEPAFQFHMNCFNGNYNKPIYDYFKGTHLTTADGASNATVNALLGGPSHIDEYGEYKLVLEKVEYKYCTKNTHDWLDGERFGAVCEVNFAVTRPYTMQISTLGVNPIATNGEAFLFDFYDMRGDQLLDSTDLASVINTDDSSYEVTTDAQEKINEFKEKYEKLAITVDRTFKVNGKSVENMFDTTATVMKVPNQHIYFIKGNGTLTLSQDKIGITAPYTIFVDGMDVEIEGNVLQYAMIITTGKMRFKDKLEGTATRCSTGGQQVVQGLFVALEGFEAGNRLRNTDVNEQWCAWGGLHVKGVLIGDGLEDLMNSKRSQLNQWFTSNPDTHSILSTRRKYIIGGASVLIEYNPSLWKTLPPGAEIFTESLEVYRK